MKNCSNCGAQLPDEAAFCPYCAQEQGEKQEIAPPRVVRKKTKLIAGGAAAALLVAVVWLLVSVHQPQTYDGEARLPYSSEQSEFELILSFAKPREDGLMPQTQTLKEASIADGEYAMFFSRLYVRKDGEWDLDGAAFLPLVADITVDAVAAEGASGLDTVDAGQLDDEETITHAAWAARFGFNNQSGDNDINWTITMKNGDVIHLTHHFCAGPEEK